MNLAHNPVPYEMRVRHADIWLVCLSEQKITKAGIVHYKNKILLVLYSNVYYRIFLVTGFSRNLIRLRIEFSLKWSINYLIVLRFKM